MRGCGLRKQHTIDGGAQTARKGAGGRLRVSQPSSISAAHTNTYLLENHKHYVSGRVFYIPMRIQRPSVVKRGGAHLFDLSV